jgi:hypothetical protein
MRKLAGVVVVLAAVWAIPGFRGQATSAALPALERLGPVGEAVGGPVRRVAARTRVTGVLRIIASDYNEGRPIPGERDFQQWMRQRMPDAGTVDPWGNPYWLQRTRGSIGVGSSGADGRRGTADDIKHTIPF